MSRGRRRSRGAFTALEVMFALAILAFAMVAVLGALSSGNAVRQLEREADLADQQISAEMESLRGRTVSQIVQAILAGDPDPDEADPTWVKTGIGLDEDGTRVNGTPGPTVVVLKDAQLTIQLLREDEVQTLLGLSARPDFDNGASGSSFSGYQVAPVRFTIQWRTSDGTPDGKLETRSRFTVFYPRSTGGAS